MSENIFFYRTRSYYTNVEWSDIFSYFTKNEKFQISKCVLHQISVRFHMVLKNCSYTNYVYCMGMSHTKCEHVGRSSMRITTIRSFFHCSTTEHNRFWQIKPIFENQYFPYQNVLHMHISSTSCQRVTDVNNRKKKNRN